MTHSAPSTLQAHLGYWLRMVSNAVSQEFARKMEGEGVTVAEWVFLRILLDAEPIAPSALAARMGMTKGAISKLADRLVAKGLVDRGANGAGPGRGQILTLQPMGQALVPRLAALADRNDEFFFAVLDPEERRELQALLSKLAAVRGLTAAPTD